MLPMELCFLPVNLMAAVFYYRENAYETRAYLSHTSDEILGKWSNVIVSTKRSVIEYVMDKVTLHKGLKKSML